MWFMFQMMIVDFNKSNWVLFNILVELVFELFSLKTFFPIISVFFDQLMGCVSWVVLPMSIMHFSYFWWVQWVVLSTGHDECCSVSGCSLMMAHFFIICISFVFLIVLVFQLVIGSICNTHTMQAYLLSYAHIFFSSCRINVTLLKTFYFFLRVKLNVWQLAYLQVKISIVQYLCWITLNYCP